MKEIKMSCGSQGCEIPAHEKILPKGKATIKVISIVKDVIVKKAA